MRSLIARLWNSPTSTTWASLAARLGSVVVLLPLVLVRFDTADVALWLVLMTITSMQVLADLGLSQTFSRAVANSRGRASIEQLSDLRSGSKSEAAPAELLGRVIQTLEPTYRWTALGFLGLLLSVGTFLVAPAVQSSVLPYQGWVAWLLVAVATAVVVWGNAFVAYLTGSEQIPVLRRWEAGFAVGGLCCSAGVVLMGGGLLTLVAVQQTWAIAAVARNRWICHADPQYRDCAHAGFDAEVLRRLWPNAWRSAVGVALSFGLVQLAALLYARVGDVRSVATYLLALRLAQTLSTFSQAPFYSKLPTLARLRATGGDVELLRLAERGMRGAHLTFCTGFLLIGLAGSPVLQHLGSRTPFASPVLWSLLGLAFFLERYGAMHMQLYSTTNHIIWHKANGLTGIVMLLLAIALYQRAGVLAFPIAMIVAYSTIYCPMSLWHSYKQFGLRFWPFDGRSAVLPFAVTIALWLAASLVLVGAGGVQVPGGAL